MLIQANVFSADANLALEKKKKVDFHVYHSKNKMGVDEDMSQP